VLGDVSEQGLGSLLAYVHEHGLNVVGFLCVCGSIGEAFVFPGDVPRDVGQGLLSVFFLNVREADLLPFSGGSFSDYAFGFGLFFLLGRKASSWLPGHL
jgi:hypothetical protein